MAHQTINPTTGELVREYPEASESEVDLILAASARAFEDWRRTSFAERATALRNAGQALFARKEELARLMAVEMGKPLAQGRSEVEKCAWVCSYYAENAELDP